MKSRSWMGARCTRGCGEHAVECGSWLPLSGGTQRRIRQSGGEPPHSTALRVRTASTARPFVQSRLVALLALCVASCVQPPVPAPQPVRAIAVFPPNNQTGDPLLIAGASFLEKYILSTQPYTVSDALAEEARAQLAKGGFEIIAAPVVDAATAHEVPLSADAAAGVAARNQLDGAVLYIEIRRWEPDVPFHPNFIIAWVTITLIDPNGTVLWTADHRSRPVPTPGVVNLGDAYADAAHRLISEMLAPLTPERPAS
jgi:hypothetical protein